MAEITGGLKKLILAGLNTMVGTSEKSIEIVGELIKSGEISADQGRVLNEELKHNPPKENAKSESASASDEVRAAMMEPSGKKEAEEAEPARAEPARAEMPEYVVAAVAAMTDDELAALEKVIAAERESRARN